MSTTAAETVGMCSERLASIQPIMQSYIDNGQLTGVETLIARRGQVVHHTTVGTLERGANELLPADSIYRIYSMTKPIVCTALMMLVDRGHCLLKESVTKYFPQFGKAKVLVVDSDAQRLENLIRPVTIADLMTHCSGLSYGFLVETPVSKMYRDAGLFADGSLTLEQEMMNLVELPLAYQPGTRWHYSVGIDVAGYLVERISGRSLRAFLREELFQPLGMDDTDFFVPEEKLSRLANMYGRP